MCLPVVTHHLYLLFPYCFTLFKSYSIYSLSAYLLLIKELPKLSLVDEYYDYYYSTSSTICPSDTLFLSLSFLTRRLKRLSCPNAKAPVTRATLTTTRRKPCEYRALKSAPRSLSTFREGNCHCAHRLLCTNTDTPFLSLSHRQRPIPVLIILATQTETH